MEHSAEYRKEIRAMKKRERKRRFIMRCCILGGAAFVLVLGITLLILQLCINSDHKAAVKEYNENNWQKIETLSNGKKIVGCINGESYSYIDDGTYFGGITVNGISLEGMTYYEAREALIEEVNSQLSEINMTVSVENTCLVLSASDFEITANVNEILNEAYTLGRESVTDYAANYLKQQEMLESNVNYTIQYTCNDVHIAEKVREVAGVVNTDPVEPYITINTRFSANSEDAVAENDEPIIRTDGALVRTVYASNGVAIADMIFNNGENGFVLDEEAMLAQILVAFEAGEYSAMLTAELIETEPKTTVEELQSSITCLSEYESYFEDSTINRRRNIQKAAGIINGCVVEAGQEISFNEYVGPRTEAGGWLPAPGITGGNTYEDSPGGGICQVSGTLYNGLLACGPNIIAITERHHHSWPSSYVPYGLDATVDTYGPDLKWKNISDNDVYIFTYADTSAGSRTMYVYVYGVPEADGSYYETYAETTDEIPHGEDIIIENPLWPTGYSKRVITARTGYRAKAYLKHFDANGELIELIDLYTDYYSPVTGQIEVGTGDPNLPRPNS